MSRHIIGQNGAPLYTVGDQEDHTVAVKWKSGPRFCQICGKELTGRKQHYCSTECKAEGKRRQAEEYQTKLRAHKAIKKVKDEDSRQRSVMVPTCICCGKPLPPRRIIYCSDVCRRQWEHAAMRSLVNEKEAEKKEAKKKKKKPMTWEQILKGMEETGMQYGEYVAFIEEGRRK